MDSLNDMHIVKYYGLTRFLCKANHRSALALLVKHNIIHLMLKTYYRQCNCQNIRYMLTMISNTVLSIYI